MQLELSCQAQDSKMFVAFAFWLLLLVLGWGGEVFQRFGRLPSHLHDLAPALPLLTAPS